MRKSITKYGSLMFLILISYSLLAQDKKIEKEERLKEEEVPDTILEKVSAYFDLAEQIRFYRETDSEKTSIEVKFLFNKSAFSIEFSDSSELEDIEKTIDFSELNEEIRTNIEKNLSSYKKYKIDKTQIQYSSPNIPDTEIIKQAIEENKGDIIRYELEITLKENKKWKAYEMLFDDTGTFISKREIIERSSDYIMY